MNTTENYDLSPNEMNLSTTEESSTELLSSNESNPLTMENDLESADISIRDKSSTVEQTNNTKWQVIWEWAKKKILALDADKLDRVSEKLNSATKSKWFTFVVIIVAAVFAFLRLCLVGNK